MNKKPLGKDPYNRGYQDWLNKRHLKFNTPVEIINKHIEKAASSKVAHLERIIAGHNNEVYDAQTENGQNIIVKISRNDNPRFDVEKTAFNMCRAVGLPTPQIKLISKEHGLTLCAEEKMPGETLLAVLKKASRSALETKHLTREVSLLLSKLHTIKISGFGYLRPNGKAWDISFERVMLELPGIKDLRKAAKQHDFNFHDVEIALNEVTQNKQLYAWSDSRLIHGDIGPDHIFIKDNKITGLIDIEEACGNHPVMDFVNWDYYWNNQIPTEEIVSYYRNKDVLSDNFEKLLWLGRLRLSLWMMHVYTQKQNPHGIKIVKENLKYDLNKIQPT